MPSLFLLGLLLVATVQAPSPSAVPKAAATADDLTAEVQRAVTAYNARDLSHRRRRRAPRCDFGPVRPRRRRMAPDAHPEHAARARHAPGRLALAQPFAALTAGLP